MELAPCPRCSRHVQVSVRRCPFCDAATPRLVPRRPTPRSDISRAAIVYFGAVLSLSACGPGALGCEPEPVLQPYGAPPEPPSEEPPSEEPPPEEPPPEEAPPEESPAEESPPDAVPSDEGRGGTLSIVQPYGAPPLPPEPTPSDEVPEAE